MTVDKKPISDPQKLEGKTIAKALDGCGTFLMRFTDGTFTALTAERGYCDDDPELNFDTNPEASNLHEIGVLSHGEYVAIANAKGEEANKEERELYERLKKKFETQE